MKKSIKLFLPVLFLFTACTKNISDLNTETKRPAEVPGATLYSSAVKSFSNTLATAAVGTNVFRHVVKHWAQAVIQEEAQYDFVTRSIPQSWWTAFYKDVLNDLQDAKRVIGEDINLAEGVRANQLAIADMMQVYGYYVLVSTFGNIPYTEALDSDNLFPVYDDAATIYSDLLQRLAQDTQNLNESAASFSATEDFIYAGNVARWKAFAGSLQLKMAMLIADSDPQKAREIVESVADQAIADPEGDASVKYFPSTPNNNPLYDQLVLAGRTDFIAAKDLIDQLLAFDDPRLPGFFGTNASGEYVGGVVGQAASYTGSSKPSSRISAPDAPNVMMDYVETEFLKAEAAERGFQVSGDAETHYNNAIRASILYWGGTQAQVDAYLAKPEVAYSTAEGDWHQKIGLQKWIALYNRPFDGWVEMRRLDFPNLPLPFGAKTGFPNRLFYPSNEQQLNGEHYTAAAAAIGGDRVETKLFWDKF